MKLEIREINEIDIDASSHLIYESRQNSPLRNETRTIDGIRKSIERMIKASDDYLQVVALKEERGELLGLLTIMMDWGEIGVMMPWQPIVPPQMNHEKIAIALIEQSKKLIQTHSKTRLEIWMDLTNEQAKAIHPTYVEWYQKCGFTLSTQEDFMDTQYSKLKEFQYSIPDDIEIVPISTISDDEIHETVFRTFRDSSDGWANIATDSQLASFIPRWLKRTDSFIERASIVFRKDDEIIGFIVMCSEPNYVEMGPIGIIPSQRGRGLGRALILESVKRLPENKQTIGLSVSPSNSIAYKLYSNLGFEKRYEIPIYSWNPG
jgi:ribosomal protein S18 acetylase RimI-like enzyme